MVIKMSYYGNFIADIIREIIGIKQKTIQFPDPGLEPMNSKRALLLTSGSTIIPTELASISCSFEILKWLLTPHVKNYDFCKE